MAAGTRRFIVSLPFREPSAREEEFGYREGCPAAGGTPARGFA
jgi:hypothetical protein